MTPEKAIEVLERGGWWDELNPDMGDADAEPLHEALDAAIAALRAQQEPIRLDRSRWEGCHLCNEKRCKTCEHTYTGNFLVFCRTCRDRNRYKPALYCPNCGRPLTEKAWAELERRIGGNDETD